MALTLCAGDLLKKTAGCRRFVFCRRAYYMRRIGQFKNRAEGVKAARLSLTRQRINRLIFCGSGLNDTEYRKIFDKILDRRARQRYNIFNFISKPLKRRSNRSERPKRAGAGGSPAASWPANGSLRARGTERLLQVSKTSARVKGRKCVGIFRRSEPVKRFKKGGTMGMQARPFVGRSVFLFSDCVCPGRTGAKQHPA